jgi:hypothetical protein
MKNSYTLNSIFSNGVSLLLESFEPIEHDEYKKNQYIIHTQKHLKHGFDGAQTQAEESKAKKLESARSSD